MDLERERGITIKAHAVRLNYKADDGRIYQLNLIDTPGPRGFHATKFRAACRPAKARCWWWTPRRASRRRRSPTRTWRCTTTWRSFRSSTRSTCRSAEPERIREQIEAVDRPGRQRRRAGQRQAGHRRSHDVLEAIVHLVPPPKGSPDAPLRALIFDSWFDPYRGVIILARVMDGRLRKGQKIRLWSNGKSFEVEGARLSVAQGRSRATNCPPAKSASCSPTSRPFPTRKIGDTITDDANPAAEPLPGFRGNQADGVRRPLPGGIARARPAARRARKAAAERQRVQLRAGELGGARLRFPLRLPRPAAPGDRAGAAGARVQHRPDHHRARACATASPPPPAK